MQLIQARRRCLCAAPSPHADAEVEPVAIEEAEETSTPSPPSQASPASLTLPLTRRYPPVGRMHIVNLILLKGEGAVREPPTQLSNGRENDDDYDGWRDEWVENEE
ncbi:hypothetical protein TSMEX_011287 [Taenia solium]|eukprot:TsM_001213800 transcript=TsM_001213800 gene=TsM_001213800